MNYRKYILFKIGTLVFLGPIYTAIISEGLRTHAPSLGQKLHRLAIPFFTAFGNYRETRNLDLAIIMSFLMLLMVWWAMERVLQIFLGDTSDHDPRFDREAYSNIMLTLGLVLLSADSLLFYSSLSQYTWGATNEFSWTSLVATVAYATILVLVSFVSLTLRPNFERKNP